MGLENLPALVGASRYLDLHYSDNVLGPIHSAFLLFLAMVTHTPRIAKLEKSLCLMLVQEGAAYRSVCFESLLPN